MTETNATYWDFPRRINSVQILVTLGTEHGMTPEALLEGSGILPESLQNPLTEIEASQELRVIRNLQQGCSHVPGLGLKAGLRYHATAFDELGYALISCESLRESFDLALRFHRLGFFFVRMRVNRSGDDVALELDASLIPADVRQFLFERDMAALSSTTRDVYPVDSPQVSAIELAFEAPAYGEMFQHLFKAPLRFGQPRNLAILPSRFLDLKPAQANPVTVRMCVALCELRLEQQAGKGGVTARVRARLLENDGMSCDMEQVASEMGMTSRTLRRRLEMEGASFRTVLDEVREVMADELFRQDGMTVEEVAGRLGFSESSSFISAFKRWKGVSPRKFHRGRAVRE